MIALAGPELHALPAKATNMLANNRRTADRPQQGSWLQLSEAIRKLGGHGMAESGDRGARMRALEWVRTELNRSDGDRLQHRYLDREGRPHENDLPTDLRLEDLRFDDCVLRHRAYSVEVLWPEEQSAKPSGRPPRDFEPAKQWLRDYIRVNGRTGQEALVAIVRDQYFRDQSPPHDKTIETKVVRPVWRELAES